MSKRIEYFDVLRALAIFGVVAIHASEAGLQFDAGSVNFNFTVWWRNAWNFAVPLFIVSSGFFLARKAVGSPAEYLAFVGKQIPRVYVPMLIWSSVWLSFAVLVRNKSAGAELSKLLTFQSSAPYYFIALIIQYYLLLPVFKRLANGRGLMLSIFVSMTMVGVIFYIRYCTAMDLPLLVYAGNFATWQMFFVLGLWLGAARRIEIPNGILAVLALALYVLSCIESYWLIAMFGQAGDAATAVKASSFMYSFVLIILLFKNEGWIKSSKLSQIGRLSFGIYLTHMLALTMAVRWLAHCAPALPAVTYVYQLLLIGMVMIACFVCISVFKRMFSGRYARLLGFD